MSVIYGLSSNKAFSPPEKKPREFDHPLTWEQLKEANQNPSEWVFPPLAEVIQLLMDRIEALEQRLNERS